MKTYSLNEVMTLLGNVRLTEQIGKITITANAKRRTMKVGNDGVATLEENKDNSHTVKIQCMGSSQVNDILSAAMLLGEASPAGNAGVIPLVIKDLQGTTAFLSLSNAIEGWPEQSLEPSKGDVEWTLLAENPARFVGGN